MSKLSFRPRVLDASKPMPIYMAEELPDLPDYSAINRAVPQIPSGMKKEEECEHHLQRAICAGLIIPTPEVMELPDKEFYDKLYPANYKQPHQLTHMQPFTMEQDILDYDMDSEDERWLQSQTQKLELSPLKFEEMMDRLEKSSGQTVVTLNEAKALLKEDDDLIIAVFDYWLNKRLKTQHPLILTVKTEHRAGTAANNPYLAFRRRTDKMQTRKIRKNDESSYEKMLKLRRDLVRAVTLLELVKKREKLKREHLHLTVEIFEKRYQARDFSGSIYAEANTIKSASRPAFTPIFHNHYTNQSWSNKAILKDEIIPRKEKRQYKKRKHKSLGHVRTSLGRNGLEGLSPLSSDEETTMPQLSPESEEVEDEGQFAFRRNKLCSYHMPLPEEGNWPWCSKEENGFADKRYRFTLTSLSNPRRCIGFARRRIGRGGRVILDRIATDYDDLWRTFDYNIYERKCDDRLRMDHETITDQLVKSEPNGRETPTSSVHTDDERIPLIKTEVIDDEQPLSQTRCVAATPTSAERDEMVELLRSVRKDCWPHFRPKTPPNDYEPPCHMLPADDCFLTGANYNQQFAMEIQSLDGPLSALLDTSTFVTDPFVLDGCSTSDGGSGCGVSDTIVTDVPINDTRQSERTTQIGPLNTLNITNDSNTYNNNNSSSSNCETTVTDNGGDSRTMIGGCSKFYVSDLSSNCTTSNSYDDNNSCVSSTLTSPKLDRVNDDRMLRTIVGCPQTNTNNSNGLLPQFGLDASKVKNKLYAYPSGVGYSNASPSTLSLHTSAHTLTLNSHSANILEIPIANDTDSVGGKLVNSQCPDSGGTKTNNKTKTIVRKNNFVMEVT